MVTYDTRVDLYIAKYPDQEQNLLRQLRDIIHEEVPEVVETISWRMPTFNYLGNLVFFAGYKNHIGFYPLPSGIEAFKQELEGFHTTKGTIQFSLDKPLPEDLVRKLIRFRVQENEKKAESKFSVEPKSGD
jgi:uncharacterized protein YdhG (YjbR/CyaY superfamily)